MRIMIRYPTLFKPLIKIIDITKPVDEWLKLSFVAYQPILQNEYKNKGTEEWSLKQSDLFNEKIVKVDLLDSKHDKQNYCLSMKLKRFRPDVLFEDDVLDWFMKATHPEDKVYPNS